MNLNTLNESYDAFSRFSKNAKLEAKQEEMMLLAKIEEAIKELISDFKNDVILDDSIDKVLEQIEAFASQVNLDISELPSELNELYNDIYEYQRNRYQAPSPYDVN